MCTRCVCVPHDHAERCLVQRPPVRSRNEWLREVSRQWPRPLAAPVRIAEDAAALHAHSPWAAAAERSQVWLRCIASVIVTNASPVDEALLLLILAFALFLALLSRHRARSAARSASNLANRAPASSSPVLLSATGGLSAITRSSLRANAPGRSGWLLAERSTRVRRSLCMQGTRTRTA